MSSPRDSLAAMLKIEPTGEGESTAELENFWGASFSCDALARAVLSATPTCVGQELHAAHATFVELPPPSTPIRLQVERFDDSDRFARRLVHLSQASRRLCEVALLFGPPRTGLAYQVTALDADLADPESLPSTAKRAEAEGWAEFASGPIEFRRLGPPWPWPEPTPHEVWVHREWIRPRRPLPPDADVQMAALVFAADFYSHWTASDRLGARFDPAAFQPLDCAVWVHLQVPWEGWWLLRATSEVGHAGRILTRRELFTAEGVLVASASLHGFYAAE